MRIMTLDYILNEKFFNYSKSRYGSGYNLKSSFYVYENPTIDEWKKYIAIEARGWVSPQGNLYIEGYEEPNIRSKIVHSDLFYSLAEKKIVSDMYAEDYYYDVDFKLHILKYGVAVQRYENTNKILYGQSVNAWDTDDEEEDTRKLQHYKLDKTIIKLFTRAHKLNPNLIFVPQQIK